MPFSGYHVHGSDVIFDKNELLPQKWHLLVRKMVVFEILCQKRQKPSQFYPPPFKREFARNCIGVFVGIGDSVTVVVNHGRVRFDL